MDRRSPTVVLLERWHAGDQTALAELLELHLPWLRRVVQRRLGPGLRARAESGDFLQDAVLDFLRDAPRFVVEGEAQFRALLARVVENTLRDREDWFRAQRRNFARESPLPSDSVVSISGAFGHSSTPSRAAMRGEVQAWVRLALELLEPEDRKLILLRDYQDVSFVEIAARLGMTANAVRMRWVRAVQRLADRIVELQHGRVADVGLDREDAR